MGCEKMKKMMISLLIIITIFLTFSIPTLALGEINPIIKSEDVTGEFSSDIEDIIVSGKAKGATASLVLNGEVSMVKGYGYENEALDIKADGISTGFRIGSVSKTFVAVATLKAMQDGLINMNTDISQYLESDFPKLKYPVTMQHLLTHTGGFEEIITGMAVKNFSDTEPLSLTVRKYMPNQIYKSGEIASYSNYGIALAAYVIERVTGTDFAEYCMNKIFLPLNMTRTTYSHMQNIVKVSHAYLPNGNETLDLFMNLYPEGSMVTTAEDMSKYIKWLLSDDDLVLSVENKLKLFDRQYRVADELGGIGYVWNRYQRNGTMYYSKKGETLHFYSRIIVIPELKSGLFLSFNTYVPDEEISAITAKVINRLLGEKEQTLAQEGTTIDIDGCYANSWSSFTTAEKLLRFFVPGRMIEITGSLSKGYTINGEKIIHIGNNAYDTPIGIIKFFVKDNKILLATDYSQTYIKINGLSNKGITILIVILFIISTLSYVIITLISKIKRKTTSIIPTLMSIIQILALIGLVAVLMIGISQYSILSFALYIFIASWIIVTAMIVKLIYSFRYKVEQDNKLIKIMSIINSVISIAFCLMLLNLNLLF